MVPGMDTEPFIRWLDKWLLTVDGEPFTTRHTGSHLLPVLRNNEKAILKIASAEEERRGAALMEWYAGAGAARVLAREDEALLLERATGVRSLAHMARSGGDDDATRILCRTARALHAPRGRTPPATLVPLAAWCGALEPAAARHGGLFTKAASVLRLLFLTPRDPVVLHGDLHHDNVLDGGQRGWLAIDPKGVLGERTFEYANLFRNPDTHVALAPGTLARRARIVASEADLDRSRLMQWVLAYAGLGAAWSLEDGLDPRPGLRIVEAAAGELGI